MCLGREKRGRIMKNPLPKMPGPIGLDGRFCTLFFSMHMYQWPKGQIVTGEFYAYSCIAAVEQHYKERRPRTICKGLRILHDNARPHKTRLVKDTLESLGIVELQHPPYNPDFSPCDFWLFNNLKSHLSGRDFETNHQFGSAIFQYLKAILKEEYKKTFHKWLERLELCVLNKGVFRTFNVIQSYLLMSNLFFYLTPGTRGLPLGFIRLWKYSTS